MRVREVRHWALAVLLAVSTLAAGRTAAAEAVRHGYDATKTLRVYDFGGRDPVALADHVLAGHLLSSYSLPADHPYTTAPLSIDWNVQYSASPSTYTLGLQTLEMVGVLCTAFERSENPTYLRRASEITASWLDYSEGDSSNDYVWYDHAVSARSLRLIHLLTLDSRMDPSLAERIHESLQKHAEYLFDPNNYYPSSNHGMMSDASLAAIAKFQPDNENAALWLQRAKERVRAQFESQFTAAGAHTENSPSYARGVLRWFLHIERFFRGFGDSMGVPGFAERARAAYSFLENVTMPNGSLASFGDSRASRRSPTERIAREFPDVVTDRSPQLVAWYPDAGYAFLRTPGDRPAATSWLGIRSGYVPGSAHKHHDDASFVFFTAGLDALVDPGAYNYEKTDPIRRYLTSSLAHNTITVDGEPFYSRPFTADQAKVLAAESFPGYQYGLATLGHYDAVSIDRHFYLLDTGVLVILDDIRAKEHHRYTRTFSINEQLSAETGPQGGIVAASSSDLNWELRILAPEPDVRVELFRGIRDGTVHSVLSRDLNHVADNSRVTFTTEGRDARLITIVDTATRGAAAWRVVEHTASKVILALGKQQVVLPLQLRDRELPDHSTVQGAFRMRYPTEFQLAIERMPVNNAFRYSVQADEDEPWSYAWYLFRDEQVVDRRWYSESNAEVEFLFPAAGTWKVRLFGRGPNGAQLIKDVDWQYAAEDSFAAELKQDGALHVRYLPKPTAQLAWYVIEGADAVEKHWYSERRSVVLAPRTDWRGYKIRYFLRADPSARPLSGVLEPCALVNCAEARVENE